MSRSKSNDRATISAATVQADREERQQIRDYRDTLQVILAGWDAASNAQRFAWIKDLIQIVRRSLRFF